MILDSSALIAVIFREKRYERLEETMTAAGELAIGAPTLFETSMVAIGTFEARGRELLQMFLEQWDVEVIPFDNRHWRVAADAFARYGKGRHPAALNFGDCMTYASARLAQMPLLFTGTDFAKTDLAAA
ncbi:MAG TPA: type II toxin-antitoxin system VapC family toxin [Solirubrobacterales bacterium]|nr:type II toxin-antitoxin system VapC family toxin [Solirubrobacterales bacterium]